LCDALGFDDWKKLPEFNSNRKRGAQKPRIAERVKGAVEKFTYDEIAGRDKTSLDIFWLRDKSLADLDNLTEPDELANDIIENLEAAVESFKKIAQRL
jgi:type I restriction enzyme M protein